MGQRQILVYAPWETYSSGYFPILRALRGESRSAAVRAPHNPWKLQVLVLSISFYCLLGSMAPGIWIHSMAAAAHIELPRHSLHVLSRQLRWNLHSSLKRALDRLLPADMKAMSHRAPARYRGTSRAQLKSRPIPH